MKPAPEEQKDEPVDTLPRQLLWSRIETLQHIDRQLSEIEELTTRLADANSALLADTRNDLLHMTALAAREGLEIPTSTVSFSFYLSKVVHMFTK